MANGSLSPELKQLGHETNHSPPSLADFKNKGGCNFALLSKYGRIYLYLSISYILTADKDIF